MWDEVDGVGACRHVRLNTLSQAADFVGGCLNPLGTVGAEFELAVFKRDAGGWIDNRVGGPVSMGGIGECSGGIECCWGWRNTTINRWGNTTIKRWEVEQEVHAGLTGGNAPMVRSVCVTVAGVVCVLFNGRNNGWECWCVGFEGSCCFASAFAGVAGDKGVGGISGEGCCRWCEHPWKCGGRRNGWSRHPWKCGGGRRSCGSGRRCGRRWWWGRGGCSRRRRSRMWRSRDMTINLVGAGGGRKNVGELVEGADVTVSEGSEWRGWGRVE